MKSHNKNSKVLILNEKKDEKPKESKRKVPIKLSATELDKLFQELEISQSELEIKNKQLILEKDTALHAVENFRGFFEDAPLGFVILSKAGDILQLNFGAAQMLGNDWLNLTGKNFARFISKEVRPAFNSFIKSLNNENSNNTFDTFININEQTPLFIHITGTYAENKEQYYLTLFDNIEHKRAEEALAESREKYRALSEASFESIFISEKGLCIEQNQTAEKMFGYSTEEAIGRPGTDWIIPEDREMVMRNMIAGHEEPYEAMALRKDGTKFPCMLLGKMMHFKGRKVRVTSLSDITQRKKAEAALQDASAYNRRLIEASIDPLVAIGPDGRITDVNSSTEQVTGFLREELIGTDFSDYFTEPEKAKAVYQQVFLKGSVYDYPLSIRHNSGKITDVLYNASVFRNEKGEIQGVFAAARDITERKRAEEALTSANEKLIYYFNEQKAMQTATLNLMEDIKTENEERKKSEAKVIVSEKIKTLSNEILILLNSNLGVKEIINGILKAIQNETKISAVGIRFENGEDFPYYQQIGFTDSFLHSENSLLAMDSKNKICRDENGNPKLVCTCGMVLSAESSHNNPFLTKGGSFFTNDSIQLLDLPIQEDHRYLPRNTCIHYGYGSICIVPIKVNNKTVGILQLNDIKNNAFTSEMVGHFENICLTIGTALMRKEAEEELRKSEGKLKAINQRLALAMKSANMAWWERDVKAGKIIFDKSKAEMLGYSPEKFNNHSDFTALLHPDDYKKVVRAIRNQYLGIDEKYEVEYRIMSSNGEYKWFYETGSIQSRDVNGNPLTITGLVIDISDRKKAEEKIRAKDIEFQKLSENMPDMIFQFTRRPDGSYHVPIASKGIKNIFGCKPEDVQYEFTPILNVIYKEDIEKLFHEIEFSAKNLSLFDCEFRVQIPGRDLQWIYSRSTPEKLDDGSITWYGFNTNVTERKKAEQEYYELSMQMRELAARIRDISETDRANIAREIHDVLGQQMTAIKFELARLKKNGQLQNHEIQDTISSINSKVDDSIQSIRKISSDLRPRILDDLGLNAAIEWYVKSFEINTGIHCVVNSNLEGIMFDKSISITFFRILQEALTNIARHAKANLVKISATFKDSTMKLEIKDNGIGFLKSEMEEKKSLGILGMNERANMIGGYVEIKGAKGKGTSLILVAPVPIPV